MTKPSATGVLLVAITGDLSSIASLGAWLPALLVDTSYSRGFETEADDFAFEYLKHNNIPTHSFTDILQRIEDKSGAKDHIPDYLSSHPATQERIQNFSNLK
jgi:predicted Zn-dependent protease